MYKIILSIILSIIIVLCVIFLLYLIHTLLLFNINPYFGLKNKGEIMDYFKEYCMDYTVIDKNNFNRHLLKQLNYPLVFKPNYCHEYAHDVAIVENYNEAITYVKNSTDNSIIIQSYHPGPYEGTIFFTKHPNTHDIDIVVVERVPQNVGEKWLWKESISFKYGYFTRHRPDLETDKLKRIITHISFKVPHFYFGRYDIRFDSDEKLKQGYGFKIIELGGYDSGDTRWDIKQSSKYNLKIIKNWLFKRYSYGLINIMNGHHCSATHFIKIFYNSLTKISKCKQEDKIKNIFIKAYHGILKNNEVKLI